MEEAPQVPGEGDPAPNCSSHGRTSSGSPRTCVPGAQGRAEHAPPRVLSRQARGLNGEGGLAWPVGCGSRLEKRLGAHLPWALPGPPRRQPPPSVSELLGLREDARCPVRSHGQHQQLTAGRPAAAPGQAEAPGEDVHQPVCQRGAETGCHIQGNRAEAALSLPHPTAPQTPSDQVPIPALPPACCVVLGGPLTFSELQRAVGESSPPSALVRLCELRAQTPRPAVVTKRRGEDGALGGPFQFMLCFRKYFIFSQVLEFNFGRNLQSMVANSTSSFIWTSKHELET